MLYPILGLLLFALVSGPAGYWLGERDANAACKQKIENIELVSRAIREAYAARLAKLEYEERTAKLISSDEVEMRTFNLARRLREYAAAEPEPLALDRIRYHRVFVSWRIVIIRHCNASGDVEITVPFEGTISVAEERYVLVRAGSLSVEFFDVVRGKDPSHSEWLTPVA